MKHVIAHSLTSQHFRTEKIKYFQLFETKAIINNRFGHLPLCGETSGHNVCYHKQAAKNIN